jgi:hypothetical protein
MNFMVCHENRNSRHRLLRISAANASEKATSIAAHREQGHLEIIFSKINNSTFDKQSG